MDEAKCAALKAELAGVDEPAMVAAERFFDGNDDLGSIGCNLSPHPGVEAFRRALGDLARRPDVSGVELAISELDPGEGSWPFSDLVVVAGAIPEDALRRALAPLRPDDVGPAAAFGLPEQVVARLGGRVLAAWWD